MHVFPRHATQNRNDTAKKEEGRGERAAYTYTYMSENRKQLRHDPERAITAGTTKEEKKRQKKKEDKKRKKKRQCRTSCSCRRGSLGQCGRGTGMRHGGRYECGLQPLGQISRTEPAVERRPQCRSTNTIPARSEQQIKNAHDDGENIVDSTHLGTPTYQTNETRKRRRNKKKRKEKKRGKW